MATTKHVPEFDMRAFQGFRAGGQFYRRSRRVGKDDQRGAVFVMTYTTPQTVAMFVARSKFSRESIVAVLMDEEEHFVLDAGVLTPFGTAFLARAMSDGEAALLLLFGVDTAKLLRG